MRKDGEEMQLRKLLALLGLLALLCSLTGCLMFSVEELYSLPRLSEDYYDLQACLDIVLNGEAELSAPVSGSQQQSVQLVDLNGDGEKEALAFIKTTGDHPLKVYVFQKLDGAYTRVATIEEEGSAFQSVEYVQLDGAGNLELVICTQLSEQVPQAVSAYSFTDSLSATELMSNACVEYQLADLDGDGCSELLLLCTSDGVSSTGGTALLYTWADGLFEKVSEAQMSVSTDAIRRIIVGNLEDAIPAVFVASLYDETSLVTDVFALRDGQLVNVAFDSDKDGSAQTVRSYYVYATDIDSDGIMELPEPIQLPATNAESSEIYWILRWYGLQLDGSTVDKALTYHNYSASWYLELPEEWLGQITVYREENAYVFAAWDAGTGQATALFSIYSAADEAPEGGTALLQQNGTTYYLILAEGAEAWEVTAESLSQRFHIIETTWYTGEM